jgi:hypothetical protein
VSRGILPSPFGGRGDGVGRADDLQGLVDLRGGELPPVPGEPGDHGKLEALVGLDRSPAIAEVIEEQGEGELGRSRPCVAPLQTRGAVVPDLEAEGEGFPVDRDGAAVGCPVALVELVALAGRDGRDLSTSYG